MTSCAGSFAPPWKPERTHRRAGRACPKGDGPEELAASLNLVGVSGDVPRLRDTTAAGELLESLQEARQENPGEDCGRAFAAADSISVAIRTEEFLRKWWGSGLTTVRGQRALVALLMAEQHLPALRTCRAPVLWTPSTTWSSITPSRTRRLGRTATVAQSSTCLGRRDVYWGQGGLTPSASKRRLLR
ncbi:hypothetical protein [Streptomyces sp. NPDC059819]|uniref:vWA-MoxR associated conflict system protein n=1 Tax=Streptomyces sp. NPDC059819 TaxID=3346963 RepID=UPI0036667A83